MGNGARGTRQSRETSSFGMRAPVRPGLGVGREQMRSSNVQAGTSRAFGQLALVLLPAGFHRSDPLGELAGALRQFTASWHHRGRSGRLGHRGGQARNGLGDA